MAQNIFFTFTTDSCFVNYASSFHRIRSESFYIILGQCRVNINDNNSTADTTDGLKWNGRSAFQLYWPHVHTEGVKYSMPS